IKAYMLKTLHEAKVHSSWLNPNAEYDEAMQGFVARILDQRANADFLNDFQSFQRRVSQFGLFNSLAQTLLRITAPGAPDTYQGTELWDFSLVDPDNRRPVNFAQHQEMLQELTGRSSDDLLALSSEMLANVFSDEGKIKLFATMRALRFRR